MDSLLQSLRDAKLMRPAGTHTPCDSGWIEDYPSRDWKSGANPAISNKKVDAIDTRRDNKPKVPVLCSHKDGCNEYVYKSGLCHFHWLERNRERNRISRARQRAKVKANGGNRPKQKVKPIRTCNECGKPALADRTVNLCRDHFNDYQKEGRQRRDAVTDAIKEESMERREKLLQDRWQKVQEKYSHENKSD